MFSWCRSRYSICPRRSASAPSSTTGRAILQLWRGPGPDRDLLEAYGPGLREALDAQREQLEGEALPIPGVVRIHPGRLHCDMLLWLATRPTETGVEREPAPDVDLLRRSVDAALDFVSTRHVQRIAFGALGAGPGEISRPERLATIIEAAQKWAERCFAEGRATGIEEVVVCEPLGSILADARRRVGHLARVAATPPPKSVAPQRSARSRAARTSTGGRSRRAAAAPRLDPDATAKARLSAEAYDRTRTYVMGDWLVHPRFGIGRVEQASAEGAMVVLFEDGQQRKLVHGR